MKKIRDLLMIFGNLSLTFWPTDVVTVQQTDARTNSETLKIQNFIFSKYDILT